MHHAQHVPLILASTSPYRRELLARLDLAFDWQAPAVDETAFAGEAAAQLALRLATAKARAVAARNAGSLVLGSDQVAECAGEPLGKPGSIEAAHRQLRASSGRTVSFHTAVCLVDARGDRTVVRQAIDVTVVTFRVLDDDEIERYVARERPLDCAGSFMAEGLGIGLFERIDSQDPTALIGLPLIAVCRLLREAGVAPI
ncbi:MAG: Maf family nucleotide pyrophosphatase [Rudaea sp.]